MLLSLNHLYSIVNSVLKSLSLLSKRLYRYTAVGYISSYNSNSRLATVIIVCAFYYIMPPTLSAALLGFFVAGRAGLTLIPWCCAHISNGCSAWDSVKINVALLLSLKPSIDIPYCLLILALYPLISLKVLLLLAITVMNMTPKNLSLKTSAY